MHRGCPSIQHSRVSCCSRCCAAVRVVAPLHISCRTCIQLFVQGDIKRTNSPQFMWLTFSRGGVKVFVLIDCSSQSMDAIQIMHTVTSAPEEEEEVKLNSWTWNFQLNYFLHSFFSSKNKPGHDRAVRPAKSKVDLNHSFFFFFFILDLFGLQSVMMDGATKYGLLWASAALKCMGRGLERWDEWNRQRDEMERPGEIYEKKAGERW